MLNPNTSLSFSPLSRAVLVELVSHRLLHLQPHPHPLLQGVLRPPLPGRLCLRVTQLSQKTKQPNNKEFLHNHKEERETDEKTAGSPRPFKV